MPRSSWIEGLGFPSPSIHDHFEVKEGTPYVILDGKIVASDRCHEKTSRRKLM